MHRQPVESSNVATIGFSNNVLEIEFKHGGVYQYFDVPVKGYIDLMKADILKGNTTISTSKTIIDIYEFPKPALQKFVQISV